MSYKFNEFKEDNFFSNSFNAGYSVQVEGDIVAEISSNSNFKSNRDIADILGDIRVEDKSCLTNTYLVPVRFDKVKRKYKPLNNPKPYTFQPETDTQPADKFVFYQVSPNNINNDEFLKELNNSNDSFCLGLLEAEKITNNHQLKIIYNGISNNYSNDKWACDGEKIKKSISSANLLKLLEIKKQLKDTTEIAIGPELASAQKSLQENPQAFFENLIEVFGDGPNATLFYANIGEILTNEQLIAFKNASVIKNINMTEEKIARVYFENLIEKYKDKILVKFENLISGGSLTPTQLLVLKDILKEKGISEKDINRVKYAKELGIKVKHLIKMENKLKADISKVKKISVGGSFGEKFKLTLKDREDTTKKQKKFAKVQRLMPSMNFLGDKIVKDSFQGKQHEHILIPDYIHISKKTLNPRPIINDTTREFIVSDFAKETKKIFLGDVYSVSRPLNSELSDPENKHAISQQLISALKQLHDEKIYHYDFKPDNVLLDKNGKVRIIDLSTATKEIKGLGESTTMSYAPPEYFNFFKKNLNNLVSHQEKRKAFSLLNREKHDVWALSLTLLSLQVGVELSNLVEHDLEGSIVSSFKDQDSINNYIDSLNISEQYKIFFKKIIIYEPSNRPDLNTIKNELGKIDLKKEKNIIQSQSQSNIPNITSSSQPNNDLFESVVAVANKVSSQPNNNDLFKSVQSTPIKPIIAKETILAVPNKLSMAKPTSTELLLSTELQKLKFSIENEKKHFNELRRSNLNDENEINDHMKKIRQLHKKEQREKHFNTPSKEYTPCQKEIFNLNSIKEKTSTKLQKNKELQELTSKHIKKLEYFYQQVSKRLEQFKLSKKQPPKLANKFSKQKETRPPFKLGRYQ